VQGRHALRAGGLRARPRDPALHLRPGVSKRFHQLMLVPRQRRARARANASCYFVLCDVQNAGGEDLAGHDPGWERSLVATGRRILVQRPQLRFPWAS
jgi:hypothetical protein